MNIQAFISKHLQAAITSARCVHAREIAWNAYLQASGAYEWYTLEHGFNAELWDWWNEEIRPEFLKLAGIKNI